MKAGWRVRTYPQPWISGWKEWQIPVGWGDLLHTLKGQINPNPTTQRFTIAPDGTATIRKYNHTIERRTNNDVYLDGVLQMQQVIGETNYCQRILSGAARADVINYMDSMFDPSNEHE